MQPSTILFLNSFFAAFILDRYISDVKSKLKVSEELILSVLNDLNRGYINLPIEDLTFCLSSALDIHKELIDNET